MSNDRSNSNNGKQGKDGAKTGKGAPRRADYKVGYGRPPKHSQYKKGQSGNVKGRTKGAKSFKTDLNEILAEKITVREGGKTRRITKQRAILTQVANAAVQGKLQALRVITDLTLRRDGAEPEPPSNRPLSREEAELLAHLLRQLGGDPDQAESNGSAEPS